MSDRDEESGGFLGRWARLKRETRKAETRPPDPAPEEEAAAPAEEEPEIDLESLPPLESLGPASDFTPFLRKGVPLALRNAALRKAWTSDPVIANFREVADYDWDYNAPGYGQLLPTDDVKKLLERLLRGSDPEPKPPHPAEDAAEDIQIAELQSDRLSPDSEPQKALEPPPDFDHLRLPSAEPPRALVQLSQKDQEEPAELRERLEYKSPDGEGEVEPDPQGPQRRRRHGGAAPR